ncbi:hypothetical protein AB0M28_15275 [Streptomyces sp. NPDC051940]|uniref:hypothetical protein n=1 Tax=Streptomyces sp. NPDC051940 TaxID=3155675 RepID=UPI00342E55BB
MGIEGDQLVLDFLSKVGDLAQQRSLPSGDRMRLVTQLRTRIDRVRAEEGAHSAAAVKRILERFGPPSAIVEAAADDPGAAIPEVVPEPPRPTGLTARLPRPRTGLERKVPRPRREPEAPVVPPPPAGASPPHLAGEDELGRPDHDWWRIEAGPFGGQSEPGPMSDIVPGFTGGIELPELLRPPVGEEPSAKKAEDEADAEDADDDEAETPARRSPGLRPLGRVLRASGPLEVLAIAALLAGAVLGQVLAVLAGWLMAYGSRRLSRTEAKWAALGVPATVATLALVWLYGRVAGRWGEPLADDAFGDALTDALPWAVRTAAVASALFLLWRARRRVPSEDA